MNKLSISIDLLKIQGAQRMTSKTGRDIVVIDLGQSRARLHNNGAVYLEIDAIENKDGPNQWGKTHFVKESMTKEERQGGLELPFLGNGKEFRDGPKQHQPRREPPPPARYQGAADAQEYAADGGEFDEVPF